jgi:hypothetical protein
MERMDITIGGWGRGEGGRESGVGVINATETGEHGSEWLSSDVDNAL